VLGKKMDDIEQLLVWVVLHVSLQNLHHAEGGRSRKEEDVYFLLYITLKGLCACLVNFFVSLCVQPMSKESENFKRLCEYVQNTHAATHQQYSLDVLDVRTVTLVLFSMLMYLILLLITIVRCNNS
jgi:uncharacterized membrane protein (UPF0182 family)